MINFSEYQWWWGKSGKFGSWKTPLSLKERKCWIVLPPIASSKPATIPLPPPQERKHRKCRQCADLLISSVGASTAASWKPHIHKANKASFFNDSSEYIFFCSSFPRPACHNGFFKRFLKLVMFKALAFPLLCLFFYVSRLSTKIEHLAFVSRWYLINIINPSHSLSLSPLSLSHALSLSPLSPSLQLYPFPPGKKGLYE